MPEDLFQPMLDSIRSTPGKGGFNHFAKSCLGGMQMRPKIFTVLIGGLISASGLVHVAVILSYPNMDLDDGTSCRDLLHKQALYFLLIA